MQSFTGIMLCVREDRKTCNDISIFIFSDWKLCLIAVTVRILHANDWLRHRIHKVCMKSAEAYQIIFYLVLLKLQLFCIVHRLNLAAAAAAGRRTAFLCSVLRRLDHAD